MFRFAFLYSLCVLFPWGQVRAQSEAQKDSAHLEMAPCVNPLLTFHFQEKVSFDPVRMDGPIYIRLFDVDKEEYWAPPLLNTRIKTSGFGPRWGKFHHGIDLALRTGDPVFSVFAGKVKVSAYDRGYGNYVLIQHDNGLETLYGHLHKRHVRRGQRVDAGTLIGRGGNTGFSTGPHLHFEVRYQGYTINPRLLYDFKKKYQIRADEFFVRPEYFRHYGNRTPAQMYVFHEVGSQEALASIAKHYSVSIQEIIDLNRLSSESVEPGQIIRVK